MSVGSLMFLVPLLALNDSGGPSMGGPSTIGQISPEPKPSLGRKFGRNATPQERRRFELLRGRSPAAVIHAVGHPINVRRYCNGEEIWDYGWEDNLGCRFRHGAVIETGEMPIQTGVISYPQLVQ